MPSPRQIALAKNDRSKFAAPDGYDAEAGTPAGVAAGKAGADHQSASIVNPPEKPAPANLKG